MYFALKREDTTNFGGDTMIHILITSVIVICFFFSFIVYCALVNKKQTPSPGQNSEDYLRIQGAYDHESIGC
jgi:hypothetical protein